MIAKSPSPRPAAARVYTMPVLPAAAARALRLLQQARVEIPRIVRTLESDAVLASAVLRRARSPLWGLSPEPADLPEAAGQLGLRRFYQLIAVASVGPLLRAPLPGCGLAEDELWEHSVSVALATREILLEKGLKPCEEAFTAGFLHDVGKLVLATDPHAGGAFDHAAMGATLLNHWGMPYWLVSAVRLHHEPSDGSFLIADLVHLAECLMLAAGPDGLDEETTAMLSRWSLTARSVSRIQERTRRRVADAGEGA